MSQDKQSVILINKQPIMKFIVDGLNSCKFGHDAIEILTELEYAPTIDAAPIVRCADCKEYDESWNRYWCRKLRMETPDDFYCKYGKAREYSKHAHWIRRKTEDGGVTYKCSSCDHFDIFDLHYCPSCNAKMREVIG